VVASSPALRATAAQRGGAFAGAVPGEATPSLVVMQALPEPKPSDIVSNVDLNRSSLYWALLCINILSVLFSSYIFN